MKHDCQECIELLGSYLDRELDIERKNRIEEHLNTCSDCRAELAALEHLHRMVREKDTGPRLAEEYWDWHRQQVWKRIRAGRRPERPTAARLGFQWFRVGVLAGGLVVALVVVIAGWQLLGTRKKGVATTIAEAPKQPGIAEEAARKSEAEDQVTVVERSTADAERARETTQAIAGTSGYSLEHKADTAFGEADTRLEVAAAKSPQVGRKASDEIVTTMSAESGKQAAVPPVAVPLELAAVVEQPPVVLNIADLPRVSPEDTATVLVRALVEPDGSVSKVEIERSSGVKLLDTIAVVNVLQARFRPAVERGRNVRSWISIPQLFRAKDVRTKDADSGHKSEKTDTPKKSDE